jgi:hypothetical protein
MIEYSLLIYVIISFIFILTKRYKWALLWPYVLCMGIIIPVLVLIKQMQKFSFKTVK